MIFLWLAMLGSVLALWNWRAHAPDDGVVATAPALEGARRHAGRGRAVPFPDLHHRTGAGLHGGSVIHRDPGARLAGFGARRGIADRLRADAGSVRAASAAAPAARGRHRGGGAGRHRRGHLARGRPDHRSWQPEPAGLLRAAARRGSADRRAHRLRLRPGHRGLPAHDHLHAACRCCLGASTRG